ncbi:hypothetical protein R8510_05219 [Ralstonia chuxiongensis]|nr:hypothetical protein R8510_05219 [Ralstonia chuxiongensis]
MSVEAGQAKRLDPLLLLGFQTSLRPLLLALVSRGQLPAHILPKLPRHSPADLPVSAAAHRRASFHFLRLGVFTYLSRFSLSVSSDTRARGQLYLATGRSA